MAGGRENLIPGNTPGGHKLTLAEQKAGGRASAAKRRKMKTLKELCEMFAGLPPSDPRVIEQMKKEGIEPDDITRGALIARNIVVGAVNQDHKAVAEYMDATGQRITRNINENHNLEYKPLIDLTNRKAVLEKKKNAGKKA